MATIPVKKGQTRALPPGESFEAGIGWDENEGQEPADNDLWIFRKYADGRVELVWWGKTRWHRPDLGMIPDPVDGEDNPYVATPEEDVIYTGDDRTGASSAGGYDEKAIITPSKAPAELVQYGLFVTAYSEDDTATLGMSTALYCGITDVKSGHQLKAIVEGKYDFDKTLLLATVDRESGDKWSMTPIEQAWDQNIFDVMRAMGCKFEGDAGYNPATDE